MNIIISDCRFPNKFELVKRLEGKIVHIKRILPDWFEEYKYGLINYEDKNV